MKDNWWNNCQKNRIAEGDLEYLNGRSQREGTAETAGDYSSYRGIALTMHSRIVDGYFIVVI